jgi:3-hydroxyisobutyrate dehydrogenase-like beta-hydroxyacid dehydrogenase
MHIAFIGFGEAARAFHDTLKAQDAALAFSAYDILFDMEGLEGACASAAHERGVTVSSTPADAVAGADWVISAVTADQSLAAARSVGAHLGPGQHFFDINSVAPERKRETEAVLAGTSAVYIDMAVMAPVHPRGHRTPVLIAGPTVEIADRLSHLGFDFDIAGEEAGAATAIKMVRSLFVKGLEAITVETMLAASASGCLDRVLASLAGSYPGLKWPDIAEYNAERMLKHGKRRAAEMRESAATLDALGLDGDLARAIAALHDRMGALPLDRLPSEDLAESARKIVALRLGGKREN